MRSPIVLLFVLALLSSSFAQHGDDIYMQVDYMKTLEGAHDDYIWMENMIYKPIHQERINTGEIVGWYLYEVQYPSGADTEYDFVTLTAYANFSLMDEFGTPYSEILSKAHPDKSEEEIAKYARDTRKLVKSEVIKSYERFPLNPDKPAKSLLVDYMKVAPVNDALYRRMESEIWQPLHKKRKDLNHIVSWGLYELMFPGGMNYPYNYATATGFKSWDMIKDSWPEGIWKDVHPSATQAELEQRAHEIRDLVSSQIWKLVDYTTAPTTASN